MSSGKIIPGFSKEFQKRLEREMLAKAKREANQIPQLPPELAQQISAGVALAMQGKFSNIQVGLGVANNVQHVRILIFKDEMNQQMKIGSVNGVPVDKLPEEKPMEVTPGSAPPPEELQAKAEALEAAREYEIGHTAKNLEELKPDDVTAYETPKESA